MLGCDGLRGWRIGWGGMRMEISCEGWCQVPAQKGVKLSSWCILNAMTVKSRWIK